VVAVVIVAIVSVLWMMAGVASSSELTPSLLEKGDRDSVQLPGGMDPEDVVRRVERNRAHMGGAYGVREFGALPLSTAGELQTAGRPAPYDEFGQAFQIGGGQLVNGPAAGDQRTTTIAFDGTNYLVVWVDHRDGMHIYGARVDAGGSVLDTAGIAICTNVFGQGFPAIAFDGTNYLVVWTDMRNNQHGDIYGARVSVGGSVLDPGGIAISTPAGVSTQDTPAIAFDGINYLVVWVDERNGRADIYGARVTKSGSVLDGAGIALCSPAWVDHPSIAFDGTNYLVVWEDRRFDSNHNIYGARVSAAGIVLDPGGINISSAPNSQRVPAIGFDGTNYLVVWSDERSGSYDIYGSRVSVDGSVLDTAGIGIATAASNPDNPAIAFDGTNYVVVWDEWRSGGDPPLDICGARVSVGGSVLDPGGVAISTAQNNQQEPAIASDGTNYLVVWEDCRSGFSWKSSSFDVYGSRFSKSAVVLDTCGVPISIAANDQGEAAVAFDGTNYLVVWQELRSGTSWDICGARVGVAGVVLDTAGIVISAKPDAQSDPAVAFDGTNYLVVWEDYRGGNWGYIYGARVSVAGIVLDTPGIAISISTADPEGDADPAIAFDGTNYLVVWNNCLGGNWGHIYGARVSVGGGVLDPGGIVISPAKDYGEEPAIAFDGTNYLVVWSVYNSLTGRADIHGARVSVGGSVLDPSAIAISTNGYDQEGPSIAFDGANYLVVWGHHDIRGSRVSVGGGVLDPGGIAISTAARNQDTPAVAFDGTNYLVVWEDYWNSTSYDIYCARVNTAGTVLDPVGMPISVQSYGQRFPAVTRGPSGRILIAYQSFGLAPYGSYRIWGNTWRVTTPIAFASASARVEQGHITLSWQMAVSAVASSFRIERSELAGGELAILELPISMSSGFNFSCADHSVLPGKTYWYRIVLVGASGVDEEAYGPIEVHVGAVPTAYAAYQSYPNPFNPVCTIRYEIPKPGRVSLHVYDIVGKPVHTLVDGWREAGIYSEVWNGKSDDGTALPSGVYFYRLEAGDFVATRKMVLIH
jgi:hypothetical protein